MAELTFKTLSFVKEKEKIRVNFMKIFYFYLENEEIDKIGKFALDKNKIIFESVPHAKAERKFNKILMRGFNNLKNRISGRKAIYVHKNSGIPLIGTNIFGLVDRNTSIIEVKPITSCNLNCIYCSVDSGMSSKSRTDFVVEREYLVEEFKKLAEFKNCDVEAHIGTQGEPFLYDEIVDLIRDLSSISQVKTISVDTNGTLLNEKVIDELAEAGLTRINLSLNALDNNIAEKLAGCSYNADKIKEIAEYAAKKIDLAIAPVLVPGFNDDEMIKIIKFAKNIQKPDKKYFIGIQNFLNYRFGRNPCKQLSWDEFYSRLKKLENETKTRLILSEEDFDIKKTKKLPSPFKKEEIIKAKVVCPGRMKNEVLTVSHDRVISVQGDIKGENIKIKIKRTKHNIFFGVAV